MTTTGLKKSESLGAIYECVPSSLSVLVHKNRSLDSFILALEQSTAQHAGLASIPGRVFAFITVRRTTGPGTSCLRMR